MKLGNLNITDKNTPRYNKIRQIIDFLDEHYDIRINRYKPSEKEIVSKTKKYEFPPSLDDISLHLQENEIAVSDSILRKIINSPNQIRNFDPIREYFDNIRGTWKGDSHIERLGTLLTAKDFGDQEEGYYQIRQLKYIKKWMVSAVACSLGLDMNHVAMGFIQEEEGTGKTSISQFIIPDTLQPMLAFSDKDKKVFNMRQAFTENFAVVFDEFLGLNAFTSETFKSTMSAKYIDVKEPHDPFPRRKPRIANAMFTTNNRTGRNKGFLYPSLGTRRFLCFHLEHIDLDKIYEDINIDQLWAEALTLLEGNFNYKFTPEDFREFKEYNTRYYIETSAVQMIEGNFEIPQNGEGENLQPVEIMQILKDNKMGTKEQLDSLTPVKVGIALTQLGFQRTSKRIQGQPRYAYYVKSLNK